MNSVDILWTFVDVLQKFYRAGPQTRGMISVYIKGWEGGVCVWVMRILDSVGAEQDINGMEQGVKNVLVLAGIELIFFTVASMGLYFGFVLEKRLITQGCFSY